MTTTRLLTATGLLATLLVAGCDNKPKNPIDRAVENTKDALDARPNEKLKDAGENISDAAQDAKQGVKDAVK